MILKFTDNDGLLLDIDDAICFLGICTLKRVREQNKREPLATIRAVYCCIGRALGIQYESISKHIHRRTHGSVVWNVSQFKARYEGEVDFQDTYNAIWEAIEKKRNPLNISEKRIDLLKKEHEIPQ